MKHLCPVCGYRELLRPPQDDTICPCCGTHFGYHDYATTHAELRQRWIAKGAPWFSRAQSPPIGWDPFAQLIQAQMIPFKLAGLRNESKADTNIPSNAEIRWTTAAAA